MRIVFVALLLSLPVSAQGKFQDRVDEAIAEGSGFLVRVLRRQPAERMRSGEISLAVLALLHCGLDRKDAVIQRGVALLSKGASQTYDVALRLMVAEMLRDPALKLLAAKDLKWLVRAQGSDGGWRYGQNARKSDNSCTQYALLGLRAANALRLDVPTRTWDRALRYVVGQITREGGTGYQDAKRATMNMTVGALSSLVIARDGVKGSRDSQKQKRAAKYQVSKAYARTLGYLTRKWSGPLVHGRSFYGLYGLERAMAFARVERLGKKDWYRLGAEWLLGQQEKKNGSWVGRSVQTSFALLFLRRATHRHGGVTMSNLSTVMAKLGPNATEKDVAALVVQLCGRGMRVCRPLLHYLESDSRVVRAAAVGALRKLTGKRFDFDPRRRYEENGEAVVRWTRHVLLAEPK